MNIEMINWYNVSQTFILWCSIHVMSPTHNIHWFSIPSIEHMILWVQKMTWVKKSYIDQSYRSKTKSSVGHGNRCKKCSTTPLMVFIVTYYSELLRAINFYYGYHFLPIEVKRVVWTLHNINIFYLVIVYIKNRMFQQRVTPNNKWH